MKLSLGTVQLGLKYGVANKTGKPSNEEAFKILKEAYDGGIDTFDTAASYGDSENILGKFIQKFSLAGKIKVVTKMAPYNNCDFADFLKKSINCSIDNLSIGYLDYYLFHNAKDYYENSQAVSIIDNYKKNGKIKKFGVSVYTKEDIEKCLSIGEIDVIQLPFNILDTRLLQNDFLIGLKQRNIEIHARSIYLQGLMLMQLTEIPQHLKEAVPFLELLNDMAEKYKLSVKELAFIYARDNVCIDKLVIGCESVEQVLDNIKMYNNIKKIPDIEEEVRKVFCIVQEKILNPALWGR